MTGDSREADPSSSHAAFRGPVFLSLGSNVGDRAAMLERARGELVREGHIEIINASSELKNAAILYADQDDFLNQILVVRSRLGPRELLHYLKQLESELGRRQRFRYGPREIDLDILAFEKVRMSDEELTLPHPGLGDREFLRTLLAELGETPESIA